MLYVLLISSLVIWLLILFSPWQPYRTKERWDVHYPGKGEDDLGDLTVLIPARNEEEVLRRTLKAVQSQGKNLRIIVIDDQSTDSTYEVATNTLNEAGGGEVIAGSEHPPGWSGKLWALEQGRRLVDSPMVMLLDADINLKPGVITGLKNRLISEEYSFLSLMAKPPLKSFWEKLMMPAFIYYFKLLYPFRISNSDSNLVAAAAGGCILTKTEVLSSIGGFESLKEAIIDDCTLARKVKEKGYRTWTGLTRSAVSIRPYKDLNEIWNMVARTAFTQLLYSSLLLLLCTVIMLLAYWIPVAGLLAGVFSADADIFNISLVVYGILSITYLPVLRFYKVSSGYALMLPFIGTLYLLMTWTSAIRYWSGERLRWRGRVEFKADRA